jgi:FG-GAP-like repeat
MWNYGGWYVALSNGNGFDTPVLWLKNQNDANGGAQTYNPGYMYAADFNGDGKTDYMFNYGGWYVALSNGIGFETPQKWLPNENSANANAPTYNINYQYIVDMNGDGKADYVWNYGGLYVALSNGQGFETPTLWLSSTNPTDQQPAYSTEKLYHYFADFTGNGKPDYMWNYNGWKVKKNLEGQRVIGSIEPGLGPVTSFNQKAMTDANIYTKDTTSVYPKIDLQYPMYVVSQVDISNGVGGTSTVSYRYGGLKAEQGTGRGMLGFRWMEGTEAATGIQSYTENSQDWPYVGMPIKSETRLLDLCGGNACVVVGSPKLLKRATSTPACKIPQTGAACAPQPTNCNDLSINPSCIAASNNRYFPHVATSTEASWDLNGTAFPVITTLYEYNPPTAGGPIWGDPTRIAVSNSGGGSKVTTNTYKVADTTNWILGRLATASVTSSSASANLGIGILPGGLITGVAPPAPLTAAQLQAAKNALPAILMLLLED